MDWPVTYHRRVRFSDSDAQGVVFNGNFLTYFDDTVTDWLDALGYDWERLTATGHDLVLARVEIDFRSPGRIGDSLITGVRATGFGTTSIRLALQTWDEATGRTVVEGRQVQVVIDPKTFAPRPVPGFLIEAIEALQGRVPSGPDQQVPSELPSPPPLDGGPQPR